MTQASFEVTHTDGTPRTGRLNLAHGTVETPVFMPVGTYGAIKTLSSEEVAELGAQIILGNTYHLYLRPGLEVIRSFNGLHRFMNWPRPILTDSGGFQVFSLGRLKKISDEGVLFQSHLNGDQIFLNPELSAQIQQTLGSDIAMVLDECPMLPNSHEAIRSAVHRSIAWAKRFLAVPRREDQLIFGILQGGTSFGLRKESLEGTATLSVDGIAIGGLSVGEPHSAMVEVLDYLKDKLPNQMPHYLMGVGTPLDLLEAIRLGIDMFDCVLPTRNARNHGFFTDDGLINILNATYRLDQAPIDEQCQCFCCRHYTRAYLRHLFQTQEILGARLATLHNLHYYFRFMRSVREAIKSSKFDSFYEKMRPRLRAAYLKTDVMGGSDV